MKDHQKHSSKTLSTALATVLAAGFVVGTASAATGPFQASELSQGHVQLAEGSCGGDAEGACGGDSEGSCGGDSADDAEGSCGGDSADDAEGSCGEGQCGG